MTSHHISDALRARIRFQASDRCGYCLSHQHHVLGLLEIEHIVPVAKGGTHDEDNLWLACRLCNGFKGTQTGGIDPVSGRRVKIFNPRVQQWNRHFSWSLDGTQIVGRTACGRLTVLALQLNHIIAVTVRRAWVAAGWHPPGTKR